MWAGCTDGSARAWRRVINNLFNYF